MLTFAFTFSIPSTLSVSAFTFPTTTTECYTSCSAALGQRFNVRVIRIVYVARFVRAAYECECAGTHSPAHLTHSRRRRSAVVINRIICDRVQYIKMSVRPHTFMQISGVRTDDLIRYNTLTHAHPKGGRASQSIIHNTIW